MKNKTTRFCKLFKNGKLDKEHDIGFTAIPEVIFERISRIKNYDKYTWKVYNIYGKCECGGEKIFNEYAYSGKMIKDQIEYIKKKKKKH